MRRQKWKSTRGSIDIKIYDKFRNAVKKRDSYRCQFPGCGHYRTGLQVHHIKRWADFVALRYATDNGICLCKKHHKLVTGNEVAYEALFRTIIWKKKYGEMGL
jgi:predicted restriction endonuclease